MAAKPKTSPVTSVNILSLQGDVHKLSDDVEFLFVLTGEIKVQLRQETIYLNQNDILLIQSNDFPIYSATGNNLVTFISLKKEFFQDNKTHTTGRFICNSVSDTERDYSELRRILSNIVLAHFEHTKLGDLHQIELCYALLYYLSCFHFNEDIKVAASEDTYGSRQSMILNYLEQNYRAPITLNDLAELTHLNTSYLSRFFKKATGDTLNNCLQNIRLRHALSDLTETNNSITTIAFENGFPSSAAFCKVFYKCYQKTPSEYRKTAEPTVAPNPSSLAAKHVDYQTVENELRAIAASPIDENISAIRYPDQINYTINDSGENKTIDSIWNKLINLGFCKNLLNSTFQSHLAMVQNEIGFAYGRIEGFLNDDIIPPLPTGGYNFSIFDSSMEILQNHRIKPFIDLTIRNETVFTIGTSRVVVSQHPTNSAKTFIKNVEDKALSLIKHAINNFGVEEVESWYFDIGINADEYLWLQEDPADFVKRCQSMYRQIKDLLPNANIGGITYNAGMRGNVLDIILTEMDKIKFTPDFISACVFPYEDSEIIDTHRRLISSDADHIYNEIIKIKKVLEGHKKITQKLWLVAMGSSLQTDDYTNDTCFQATFLTKNTIDLVGLVDAIGYWKLSDSADEYSDSNRILFGSPGIVSKNGLKKPGFAALKRLNQISNILIKKEDGLMAVSNGINLYNIVLYNYTHFNEMFCISGGQGMEIEMAYSIFSDQMTKDISLTLEGLENGRYKVITSTINREHGSLFDEWMRFGIIDDLQPNDINYLRDIVHPQRISHYVECTDNTLNLHTQLLTHEVKFYEIIREL